MPDRFALLNQKPWSYSHRCFNKHQPVRNAEAKVSNCTSDVLFT